MFASTNICKQMLEVTYYDIYHKEHILPKNGAFSELMQHWAKISLLNFSGILFKIAILFAELNQDEMPSFLPKDLPHTSFKCQRACMYFCFHMLQKNLRICAIFNTKIITDCKKDALTKLSR